MYNMWWSMPSKISIDFKQFVAAESTWSPSKNNQFDISLHQICELHGLHLVHLDSIWTPHGLR